MTRSLYGVIAAWALAILPMQAPGQPAIDAPVHPSINPPIKKLAPEFLAWCKAHREDKCRIVAIKYRQAMADETNKNSDLPQICVPNPIAGDALTDHIIRRIESEPELQQLHGGEAIAEIMMQDYLCEAP